MASPLIRTLLTTACLLACLRQVQATVIYYDGQTADSDYIQTAYHPDGLIYTLANSQTLPVTGGKRVTNGMGDGGNGNDYLALSLAAGDAWDQAGLLDAGSGTVGGGAVSGTIYLGFLVRAQNAAGPASENKSGDPQGTYAAFQLGRPFTAVLGLGNHWNAWAYSIFGATGDRDLVQGGGGNTWLDVNTTTHWMVARLTFQPGAPDDVTVWLDPNPDDLDNQASGVRRYAATAAGDLSFNEIAYRSGNLGSLSAWEIDEVRFASSWASLVSVVPEPASAGLVGLDALLLARRRALR
jgi:hypothetical protein